MHALPRALPASLMSQNCKHNLISRELIKRVSLDWPSLIVAFHLRISQTQPAVEMQTDQGPEGQEGETHPKNDI